MSEQHKHVIDAVAFTGAWGTVLGILPALAAAASLIWTCIRIYETKTVQRLIGKHKVTEEA